MNFAEATAYVACTILAALTVFQLALIAGAPLGRYAWGGSHTVLPNRLRVGSVVSIILYGIFSIIVLGKAGLIDIIANDNVINMGIWILTVYFFIGVVMNGISRSKSERAVMTPVALALGISCLLLALG
jgi:hypothetical protein